MSSPRAATSVATSSSVRPLRSRSTTRVRCSWSMPPCSASARSPRAVSVSVTASTSRRVRQNTMAAVGRSASSTRPSAAVVCVRGTR